MHMRKRHHYRPFVGVAYKNFAARLYRSPQFKTLPTPLIYLLRFAQENLPSSKKFEISSKQFGLFKDQDMLWRCGGRLENSALLEDTTHSVLLDKGHHLTKLIIEDYHKGHSV